MNYCQMPMFVFVCALLAAGCTSEKPKEQSEKKNEKPGVVALSRTSIESIRLHAEPAAERVITGTVIAPARLTPDQDRMAEVGSLVQGRVKRVFVNTGDAVRRGDILMELVGLEIGEIKGRFITAKAQVTLAEAALKRQRMLMEQNAGSQKALAEAEAEYRKASAEFNAEDRRIHSIGFTDEDIAERAGEGPSHDEGLLPVRAPIAGVVAERRVVPGQLVEVSTTAFRIVDASVLWAEGQVYEKDVALMNGRPAVQLLVTAYPGREFPGTVRVVAPGVDEQTRTVMVRAVIPNGAGVLKPQMFGELHIPVGSPVPRLAVPTACIQEEGGKHFVFVAVKDTVFERRDVVTGAVGGGWTEIREGIAKGEHVVTAGAFELKSELLKDSLGEGE